jgi:hypothetical protein
MACPLPADFSPQPDACVPGDFTSWCASLSPPAKPIPVWWSSACVSYDIQKDASKQVPYDVADRLFATAFAKWTSIDCAGSEKYATGRVSIDVRDLGPVACNQVQYNQDQGNQHVIIFHDDVWPHNDSNNTLGLTTITYDPDTGEIYDADMEINGTVPLTVGDPVPRDGYDFESIITHESGHFLGMAHSGDERATMYAHYALGTTTMRELSADDVGGLCTIYLPDGARVVDRSVTPDGSGRIPEAACDPTPRHGFSTQCAPASKSKGCDVSGSGASGGGGSLAVGAALALAACAGIGIGKRRRNLAEGRGARGRRATT